MHSITFDPDKQTSMELISPVSTLTEDVRFSQLSSTGSSLKGISISPSIKSVLVERKPVPYRSSEVYRPVSQLPHASTEVGPERVLFEEKLPGPSVDKENLANLDLGKEVVPRNGSELPEVCKEFPPPPTDKRRSSSKRCTWLLLCAIITVFAVVVPVGVVFSRRHSHNHRSEPDPVAVFGGVLDPRYFSRSGAFNGSGVAMAAANPSQDASMCIFAQAYDGSVRQYFRDAYGQWSTLSSDLVPDARNATPLSTVNIAVGNVTYWHLFYIDKDHHVRQVWTSNEGQWRNWREGPLNALNLTAYDGDRLGLQACYWGNYYGDLNSSHWDGSAATSESSTASPKAGMHLWHASSATDIQQYAWANDAAGWIFEKTWSDVNARAGVGCQTWINGPTYYLSFVNLEDELEIWWKDSDLNKTSTKTHPINEWTRTNLTLPNANAVSAIGFTNYLTYQDTDNVMRGANVTWEAENTTVAVLQNGMPDEIAIPNHPALNGTHMCVTAYKDDLSNVVMALFYQNRGDDLSMASLTTNISSQWSIENLPVSW